MKIVTFSFPPIFSFFLFSNLIMLQFRTNGFNAQSCKYSPFYDNKLAVATSANFGLVGNGKLFILSIQNDGMITVDKTFDTQDGLFDVCWSEIHENQVLTCSGDGSISLFDTNMNNYPIKKWNEHKMEVFSVNWNLINKSIFCSSSWDGTIKVWDPQRENSIATFIQQTKNSDYRIDHINSPPMAPPPMGNINHNHQQQQQQQQQHQKKNSNCVYQAIFSPHDPNTLTSISSSSHIQVWDLRSSLNTGPICDFIGHKGLEILSVDYNKYRPHIIATGSVDKSIKIWDLRMIPPKVNGLIPHADKMGPTPVNKLIGHDFAIKRVTWSPYDSDKLMSASYDMSVKIWQDHPIGPGRRAFHGDALINNFTRHREFVMGCDWSLWAKGYVASAGWDEMVYVWKA